jgi:protein tyrosine phosphatase
MSGKAKFCHFHKKDNLVELKSLEIKNLNKTIERKNSKLNQEVKLVKDRYERLLELKQDEINELNLEINHMWDDYHRYQEIVAYETYKQELINKGVDIYNYCNADFHKHRQKRNALAHRVK